MWILDKFWTNLQYFRNHLKRANIKIIFFIRKIQKKSYFIRESGDIFFNIHVKPAPSMSITIAVHSPYITAVFHHYYYLDVRTDFKEVCWFFKNGNCKYGKECQKEHPKACRIFKQYGLKRHNPKGCDSKCGFMHPNAEFLMNIQNDKNTVSCPLKSNSNTIEFTVQTSCYWGLRLTLCYLQGFLDFSRL